MVTDANLLGSIVGSGISLLPTDQHHLGLSTYDRALFSQACNLFARKWGF